MDVVAMIHARFFVRLLALLAGGSGALLALLHLPWASAVTLLAGCVFLAMAARMTLGGNLNLTAIFLLFFGLYGLSGPISVLAGWGLSDRLSDSIDLSGFLFAQGLATVGLALALLLLPRLPNEEGLDVRTFAFSSRTVYRSALGLAVLASLMEIANFIRIGGVASLTAGKAGYQSRETEIFLTLPSQIMATLAFAVMAVATLALQEEGVSRIRIRRALLRFLILLAPILTTTLMLGRRGSLVAWALALFIGMHLYQPRTRLRWRTFVWLLLLYTCASVVFAQRSTFAYGLGTGDWYYFKRYLTDAKTNAQAINPGQGEFGVPFSNFSVYNLNRGLAGSEYRLGSTYIEGLAISIPGFMYPGTKPQQITYTFRDQFYPDYAADGSISGTGFSSILEAYMNFGYPGVLLVYFIIGLGLYLIEFLMKYCVRTSNLAGIIFYLSFLSLAQSFHRSALGPVLSEVSLEMVLISIVLLAFKMTGTRARTALTVRPVA